MMKIPSVVLAGVALLMVSPGRSESSAAAAGAVVTPPAAASSTTAPAVPYPQPPAKLPGHGLAQHDFLYSGEFDTRNKEQTMFLVRGGKVVWTYRIPIND